MEGEGGGRREREYGNSSRAWFHITLNNMTHKNDAVFLVLDNSHNSKDKIHDVKNHQSPTLLKYPQSLASSPSPKQQQSP